MRKLSPEIAVDAARSARDFLATFTGQDFGEFCEPQPYDRRHLAIALDHIEALTAMVLALAEQVPTHSTGDVGVGLSSDGRPQPMQRVPHHTTKFNRLGNQTMTNDDIAPTQEELDTAYKSGRIAASEGQPISYCPIIRGELCIQWVNGWKAETMASVIGPNVASDENILQIDTDLEIAAQDQIAKPADQESADHGSKAYAQQIDAIIMRREQPREDEHAQ